MERSPPPPRRTPALMEELVEEILFRLPLDEPACLVRAALVCKPWRRILSDRDFHRRYREFHRSPPMLGYIHNLYYGSDVKPSIVPVSTASIPFFSQPLHRLWVAVDCRHGRILIINYYPDPAARLIIWEPITGDQKHLSVPNYPHDLHIAAVLCDVDRCDHLNCHGGPFRVVFVGAEWVAKEYVIRASVYTSETCKWSSPTYICAKNYLKNKPSLLIGDALYFPLRSGILRYDLSKHALSVIDTPLPGATIMIAEDGGLGLISVLDDTIFTWSLNSASTKGAARWAQRFVMELGTLLPSHPSRLFTEVVGLVEGTDNIFINSNVGLFTLDLKSRLLRKVGQGKDLYDSVLPYTSFYIPDLGKG